MVSIKDVLEESDVMKTILKQQEILDKISYSPAIEAVRRNQEAYENLTVPFRQQTRLIENLSKTTAVQQAIDSAHQTNMGINMTTLMPEIPTINTPIVQLSELAVPPITENPIEKMGLAVYDGLHRMSDVIAKITSNINFEAIVNFNNAFASAMQNALKNALLPIGKMLLNLYNANIDFEKYEKSYLDCMWKRKWFPYLLENMSLTGMI
ncbi:MAG: hypothetical protein LBT21_00840 [Oscillospiraceae bacterium]|jgi:hypothetical protein|nr:hypothetical protein [Oscillospiraceae bacterium]